MIRLVVINDTVTGVNLFDKENMTQTKQSKEEGRHKRSSLSPVERQTEAAHKGGTIWEAVRKADQIGLERLLNADPNSVNERGPVGDCPIHMLFLYGTENHINMAQYLVRRCPETVIQAYDQSEYRGEVVLHIAIIKRNAAMVEWLLSNEHSKFYREQQLAATANGSFFQFGRPCYYGETPLAFACCTNQWDIAEILLRHGASMDTVDSNGNTIFHLVVIHNKPKIYSKFKECWLKAETMNGEQKNKTVPLWKRLNNDGYTPFTLSAKLGVTEMFSFLFDELKIVQWSYGPVSCVLYPLDELETERKGERMAPGALEVIVQNAQSELIIHPRIIDLVDKKWECFARQSFFRRFLVTLVYLLSFLLTTILDQTRTDIVEDQDGHMKIIGAEHPGVIHRTLCTTGRLIVLTGAISKSESELKEMANFLSILHDD
ncbi:unnamed protein product [Adineta ricciae]|uniref:Uncharacterized protein n=1 Tax=Adineta ricciae TaxID=249248 RepID=A0A815TIP9_ADIRI|nr:unnamed protein product [Adineta ricciae]